MVYVPINPSSSYSLTAVENYAPRAGAADIGLANFGGGRGRGAAGGPAPAAPPIATPAPYGPIRRGADGNPIRGGILTAWDPATQKEMWWVPGGGNLDGGVVTTASNLVVQTTPNGHLMGYTADKGEKVLDITLPLTSGVGPPMTYLLDGKQYIAVMAGQGAVGRGGGGGGGGGGRGNRGPAEPTAAAAGNVPPAPAPAAAANAAPPADQAAPAAPAANKPKLFVYTLDAPGGQR